MCIVKNGLKCEGRCPKGRGAAGFTGKGLAWKKNVRIYLILFGNLVISTAQHLRILLMQTKIT